ncbi:MAG: hypothetical protein A2X23_06395 [Chloroflexi bacterium GWC2_73_18]|nr:MAG: hypothetical protein A2X23_06395 [Chloroflexi bacterium GWC2_73_18]
MSPPVIAILLIAALLHAAWNVLLKTSVDPLRMAARAVGSAMLIVTPLAAAAWWLTGRPGLPPEGWLLAGLSGFMELVYFALLSAAYRRGDLSTVYPLARGTAPLLAVLAGVFLVGERLSPLAAVGVACLLAGIWAVRRPVAGGPAVVWAILCGVSIAVYSVFDRLGVRLGPPWLYGWALWVAGAGFLWGWIWLEDRHALSDRFWRAFEAIRPGSSAAARVAPADPPHPADASAGPGWQRAMVLGLLMVGTYLAVLLALSLAPLATVAPFRESAIVLAAGWGVFRLGERSGAWLRLGGAVSIVAGAALVAIG